MLPDMVIAPTYEEFQPVLKKRLKLMGIDHHQLNKRARERDFEVEEKQKEESQKNKNFVQFDRMNMGAVREMALENPVAMSIFVFLSEYMNRRNAVVCPSRVLEEVTGKGRVTISRAIKYLKEKEYVTVLKSGNTNVYVLNPHVVWSSARTGKSFCEFQGTVLISKSENDKLIDSIIKKYNTEVDSK